MENPSIPVKIAELIRQKIRAITAAVKSLATKVQLEVEAIGQLFAIWKSTWSTSGKQRAWGRRELKRHNAKRSENLANLAQRKILHPHQG